MGNFYSKKYLKDLRLRIDKNAYVNENFYEINYLKIYLKTSEGIHKAKNKKIFELVYFKKSKRMSLNELEDIFFIDFSNKTSNKSLKKLNLKTNQNSFLEFSRNEFLNKQNIDNIISNNSINCNLLKANEDKSNNKNICISPNKNINSNNFSILNSLKNFNSSLKSKKTYNYINRNYSKKKTFSSQNHLLLNNDSSLLNNNNNNNYINSIKHGKNTSSSKINEENSIFYHKINNFSKVAHEFKTPLNAIIGLISEIKNNPTIISKVLSNIEIIDNLSNYLIFLITDITQFINQNTNPNIVIITETISLKPITEFCFEILNSLLICKNSNKCIRTFTDYDQNLDEIQIISNEMRIKQLLLNFISNSVKFTKNGSINIKSALKTKQNKKYIKISVIDTGIGIREEDQKKIFNEIYSDMKNENNKHGSGLGLSICKFISEKLNHKLEFKSVYGKGSKFSILIFEENLKINQNIKIVNQYFNKSNVIKYKINNNICYLNKKISDNKLNEIKNKYTMLESSVFSGEVMSLWAIIIDCKDIFSMEVCKIVKISSLFHRNYLSFLLESNFLMVEDD